MNIPVKYIHLGIVKANNTIAISITWNVTTT